MGSRRGAANARSFRLARMRLQARGVHQHLRRPAIDVPLADQLAHHAHAVALLLLRHQQRALERGSHGCGVVRIDDERLGQSREAPAKLDRKGVGSPEQLVDLVRRMVADHELDRAIAAIAMTLVDFSGEAQALLLQLAVLFQPIARRRCSLNEHQPVLPARLARKEIVDRP